MKASRNSPELVNQLVNDNIKLAYFFANKSLDIDHDEALSRALQGLQSAAEQWDESRGKFSVIASYKIRSSLSRVRQDRSCIKRGGNVVTISLNDLVGEEGREIGDFVADECADDALSAICSDDNKQILAELLPKLPAKLRDVLIMRFGLNGVERCKLDLIAQQFGVTRQCIQQREAQAVTELAKLYRQREKFGDKKREPLVIPAPRRIAVQIPFTFRFEILRIKSYRDVITSDGLSQEEREEVKHLLKIGCSHHGPRGFYGRNKQRFVEAVPLFAGGSVPTREIARQMGITERLATRFRLAANLPKYEGRRGFYVPQKSLDARVPA